MTTGRYPRRPPSLRPTGARRTPREENFFLVMVGCSLAVHVLAAAIFAHTPPPPVQHRPATVYVDLVLAPVANPQRGEAASRRRMAVPVAAPTPSPLPARAAKDVVVLKGKEIRKEAPANRDDIAADIARIRAKVELENAEQAINRMKGKKLPAPQVAAAIGSADASGDKTGGGINIWIYEEFRSKWKLSKYQIKNPNLKVSIMIEYDKNGTLINSKFEWSGDGAFDDSIRKAFEIFSKEKLPATFLVGVQKNFEDRIILTPNELFEK